MASDVTTKRIPTSLLGKLFGPAITLAGVGWIVHLALPASGTMFDDDNFGGSVVLGGIALVVICVGAVVTWTVSRTVTLEGPCPRCGIVASRDFDKPDDPKSAPSACGSCIAYLRGNGDVFREEPIEATNTSGVYYTLTSDQYEPAIKDSSGRYFKFIMPKMCAICGDPNAPQQLVIRNSDASSKHELDFITQGNVNKNPTARIEPTDDEKRNDKLSNLRAPVCDKHTDKFDFGRALYCSNGKLRFASYRYYKAFCELNHITHASRKGEQAKSAA